MSDAGADGEASGGGGIIGDAGEIFGGDGVDAPGGWWAGDRVAVDARRGGGAEGAVPGVDVLVGGVGEDPLEETGLNNSSKVFDAFGQLFQVEVYAGEIDAAEGIVGADVEFDCAFLQARQCGVGDGVKELLAIGKANEGNALGQSIASLADGGDHFGKGFVASGLAIAADNDGIEAFFREALLHPLDDLVDSCVAVPAGIRVRAPTQLTVDTVERTEFFVSGERIDAEDMAVASGLKRSIHRRVIQVVACVWVRVAIHAFGFSILGHFLSPGLR